MSISNILGSHVISNAWMNSDGNPATNAPGHAGLSQVDIFDISANAGSDVVRIPLSLRDAVANANGSYTLPTWQIDAVIRPILEDAAARAAAGKSVEVILQLGETPLGVPANDFATIAGTSAAFVDSIYSGVGPLKSLITAWEIGNEPNERHIGLYKGVPQDFADYVASVAAAVKPLEAKHDATIDVVVGAIAYNNVEYMTGVFERLGFNPDIDGFAIHPYTYQPDQSERDGPADSISFRSKRPTDWHDTDGPQDHNDFQGAIYNLQQLMNDYGYQGRDLYITEVGAPSWSGFRNSGPEGRADQARWIGEALGVLDAWDNPNLEAVVVHAALDFELGPYNDQFNLFDGNPANNNDGFDGETSFGLFERLAEGGPPTAKTSAYVFSAVQGEFTPRTDLFPEDLAGELDRARIVVGRDGAETIDLSARSGGGGLTNGWIALAQGGADDLRGSAFADTLFGGGGTDTVRAGAGNDRIYGGAGNDVLYGEAGDDDLYGNTGDDTINPGTGTNRVDGGTGIDTLVLDGRSGDYVIGGDGRAMTVDGLGVAASAINMERVYFIADGATRELANADTARGNGLGATGDGPGAETLYLDAPATQWLTGNTANDVFVIDARASSYQAGPTEDGAGTVVWSGARFDILSGFETLRFTDRDVQAGPGGRFVIPQDGGPTAPGTGEALQYDEPQTQWANGTGDRDVFVYAEASTGYQAGPTQDGRGIVVWKGEKFDILTGFETLRFPDRDVQAGPGGRFDIAGVVGPGGIVVDDVPGVTQHLAGTVGQDVFRVAGNAADFGYGRAADGVATVVWQGSQFDVLNDFETIRFNDRDIATIDL